MRSWAFALRDESRMHSMRDLMAIFVMPERTPRWVASTFPKISIFSAKSLSTFLSTLLVEAFLWWPAWLGDEKVLPFSEITAETWDSIVTRSSQIFLNTGYTSPVSCS